MSKLYSEDDLITKQTIAAGTRHVYKVHVKLRNRLTQSTSCVHARLWSILRRAVHNPITVSYMLLCGHEFLRAVASSRRIQRAAVVMPSVGPKRAASWMVNSRSPSGIAGLLRS